MNWPVTSKTSCAHFVLQFPLSCSVTSLLLILTLRYCTQMLGLLVIFWSGPVKVVFPVLTDSLICFSKGFKQNLKKMLLKLEYSVIQFCDFNICGFSGKCVSYKDTAPLQIKCFQSLACLEMSAGALTAV